MRFAPAFLVLALTIALISCGKDTDNCTYLQRLTGDTQCRPLNDSYTRTRNAGATCSVTGSKRLSVSCPSSSATYCYTTSNGTNVYALILPNTGGTYVESVSGTVYTSCNQVWNDMYNGVAFNNIAGVYFGTGGSDTVSCTASTCTVASSSFCFSTWDPVNRVPAGTAAVLPTGTTYLACIYIDSLNYTYLYGYPPSWSGGIPANNGTAGFQTIVSAAPIAFNSWLNYN